MQDELLDSLYEDYKDIRLKNPLNEELSVMRKSLIPGLFKNMAHNLRYGNNKGRLFEIGNVFKAIEEEHLNLAFMFWSQKDHIWSKETQRPVIYDLKIRF